jgi:hypothetical protein
VNIADLRAKVSALTAQHLHEALATEGVFVADGQRIVERAARVISVKQLAIAGFSLTQKAADRAARLGLSHATDELALLSQEAGQVARKTTLRGFEESRVAEVWRGLSERVSEAIATLEDKPGGILAEADQVSRILTTEFWIAYNRARDDVAQHVSDTPGKTYTTKVAIEPRLDPKDFFVGIVKHWDATLDKRTCPTCKSYAGEITLLGAYWGHSSPPAHPRCRCAVGYWPIPVPYPP